MLCFVALAPAYLKVGIRVVLWLEKQILSQDFWILILGQPLLVPQFPFLRTNNTGLAHKVVVES